MSRPGKMRAGFCLGLALGNMIAGWQWENGRSLFIPAIMEGVFASVLIVWFKFQAGDYFRRGIREMEYQRDYKA